MANDTGHHFSMVQIINRHRWRPKSMANDMGRHFNMGQTINKSRVKGGVLNLWQMTWDTILVWGKL